MRVQVSAPADADPLQIAQAIVGPHQLLKAEHTHPASRRSFDRWKAMAELHDKILAAYQAQLARMVHRVRSYVEGIHGKKLAKAVPPVLPLLTPAQLEQIAQIIRDHHVGFAVQLGADTAATASELERLVAEGALPPQALDIIGDAYQYGKLTGTLRQFDDQARAKKFNYDEFKKRLEARPVALTQHDKAAIEWSKHSVGIHVKGLGNKIADDMSTVLIDADAELRRQYVTTIRDAATENIERHQTWKRFASEIGDRTEDWSRDLMRIAATEKQAAMQEGFASSLMDREGDPETVLVAKLPRDDACKDCIRLHLTGGLGSAPRIFTLKQLTANGTNVGRKRAEWKAVVGTVHPWCSCELVHVPPGWGFQTKPPEGEGWQKVPGQKIAWRRQKEDESWEYWRPDIDVMLERSARFEIDLRKAFMQYTDVPDEGVVIRLGDPSVRAAVEEVLTRTPPELLTRKTGVTLITTDIPRPLTALAAGDLAYWTGNEIRLSQTLPAERVKAVLEHELGHAPNVALMHRLGSEAAVRAWHDQLYAVSAREGFVSEYARTHPIENAAEVSRLYLFEQPFLLGKYPRQFLVVHSAYKHFLPSKAA